MGSRHVGLAARGNVRGDCSTEIRQRTHLGDASGCDVFVALRVFGALCELVCDLGILVWLFVRASTDVNIRTTRTSRARRTARIFFLSARRLRRYRVGAEDVDRVGELYEALRWVAAVAEHATL